MRPEAIGTDSSALEIGPVRVRDAAFFGTHCRAHVIPDASPDLVLVAHLPPETVPEAGARLTLYAATDPLSVFAKE